MEWRKIVGNMSALALLLSLFGPGCTKGPDAAAVAAAKRTDLRIWSSVDDSDVYELILNDYRKLHPYANIEYRRFRFEEYEDQLVNAFAEDRGPDIFLIHNTWVGKYLPKISLMPASTKIAAQTVTGTIKKEVSYKLVTEPSVTLRQFKNEYPDTVSNDLILGSRIVGIPLSVDTLAMYVNKDLLNAAGIATIPETWDAIQAAIIKLTKLNSKGEILQSGAALGTGANVERSPDILSILMMQNGAVMSTPDGSPLFHLVPTASEGQRTEPPSYQALTFYTDFANPAKEVYAWNAQQPNSLEAFLQGKVAFFFGYSYHLPTIKARASKLNLGIAKLPQIAGNPTVNYASYWTWVVAKKSPSQDLAWNLLNFMRTPEESKKYLDAAHRPAALKSQLASQLENEEVGVFASQVLTSKSWYRGNDPRIADTAMSALIESTLAGGPESIPDAIKTAAEKIGQTISIYP